MSDTAPTVDWTKDVGMFPRRDTSQWFAYLNPSQHLTRGELGERILQAYAAGVPRIQIARMMRISEGYVSRLARAAREFKEGP